MTADALRADAPWWRDAVFYQVYPRSFASSAGGAVGDLAGIRAHLDYLVWLGVDALWVSPFYRSPMADYGYDVSDYCDVDPMFGTLEDFDALVRDAHALGLRVMIDWVPSHTSSAHPWFERACADPSSPERRYYVFADPAPDGGPPNNWTCTFSPGATAWAREPSGAQYYLHSFLPEQPDLDWHDDGLAARMLDTLRFWLDRGVDGFRIDVVHNMCKDPSLRDLPEAIAKAPQMLFNDQPGTHARLREIRTLVDAYPGQRTTVGEVFLLDTEQVARYYGQGDELHMAFNFPPLYAEWRADAFRACIEATEKALGAAGGWPTWVLSNHDQKRHRTRHGGSEARARAASVLLLTLRGTPFVFQGEELGLEDAVLDPGQVRDPGGRDGARAPIPWTTGRGHGWSSSPWLPLPPESDGRNVAAQQADAGGILHLYRDLLSLRRRSPALRGGTLHLLDAPSEVLAYDRTLDGATYTILINFGAAAVDVGRAGARLLLHSQRRVTSGEPFAGRLEPDAAVVLVPAGD